MRPFHFAADHARALLIAGLAAALLLPGPAQAMRPWLPEIVAGLLFLAALRVGAKAALGTLSDARPALAAVFGFQCLAPLCAAAAAWAGGWLDTPLAAAVILTLCAPPVTAAPHFAVMTGHDPAPALRLLTAGTALLPLTALPSLALLPGLGAPEAAAAALKLFLVIGLTAAAAFVLRALLLPEPSQSALKTLDGAAAVALAAAVMPLMSAVGPALRHDLGGLAFWLCAAFALNLGLQILFFTFTRRTRAGAGLGGAAVPFSIAAGNRNVALFFAALAPEITGPLLLFIGCYQAPMYLTPVIMRRLYRRPGG